MTSDRSAPLHQPPRNMLGAVGFSLSFLGLLVQVTLTILYLNEVGVVREQGTWTLIACGVLSPLGLLLSGVSVFRIPKGLATAGVLFGLLGTLFLAGAGALLVANDLELFTPREELEKQREEKTVAAVKRATQVIQNHIKQNGVPPSDADGRRLISGYVDGWGKPLQYLAVGPNKFLVTSAGPDGEYGNVDDITNETVNRDDNTLEGSLSIELGGGQQVINQGRRRRP
jgi:hypothetical protein